MSERVKGAIAVSLLFRLAKSSDGTPATGLAVTALNLQYARPGASPSTVAPLTLLGSIAASFSALGSIEIDGTSSPGLYRVDVPAAAFASGADEVAISISGAAIQPQTRLIDLTAFDARNAINGALTALPAAASGSGAGAVALVSTVPTDYQQRGQAVTLPAGASTPAGTVVAGSTASSITVSGLPTGRNYGTQRLYDVTSGEARTVASQSVSGSNYVFTLGSGTGEAGPFSVAPSAGTLVVPVP